MARSPREIARFVFVLGAERVVPATGRSHLYSLLAESEARRRSVEPRVLCGLLRHTPRCPRHAPPRQPGGPAGRRARSHPDVARPGALRRLRRGPGTAPTRHARPGERAPGPVPPPTDLGQLPGPLRAIDQGSPTLNIPRYNGGLFAVAPVLDQQLVVSDAACERFTVLGRYDYRAPAEVSEAIAMGDGAPATTPIVDVEILGHIFEQSISELEALRATLTAPPADVHTVSRTAPVGEPGPRTGGGGLTGALSSRRRREGAFYTQRFVTRYLVSRALRPVLDRRFEALRGRVEDSLREAEPTRTHWRVLDDPRAYANEKLNEPQRAALVQFWEAWLAELQTVRVLDPACGSGAFLTEAFDQLHAEYERATDTLEGSPPPGARAVRPRSDDPAGEPLRRGPQRRSDRHRPAFGVDQDRAARQGAHRSRREHPCGEQRGERRRDGLPGLRLGGRVPDHHGRGRI